MVHTAAVTLNLKHYSMSKAHPPTYHTIKTGHSINWEEVGIIDRDPLTPPRRISEAIAIRLHNPGMNR